MQKDPPMTETPARWSAVVRTAGGSPESLSDGGGRTPEMSGYQTTFRSFSIESLIGRDDENGGGERTRVESLITPSVNVDYQRRPGSGTPPATIESMRTTRSPYDYYHCVMMNSNGAEVLAAASPSSRRDVGLMQQHRRLSSYFDGVLPPPPLPDHCRHQDIDYFKVLQLQSAAAAAAAAAAIARKTFSLQRSAWPDVLSVTAGLPQPLSFADDADDGEDRPRISPGCAMAAAASQGLPSSRPIARGFVRHDGSDDYDDDDDDNDGDDNDDDDDGDGDDNDDDDDGDGDDDHPSVNQRLSE